MNPAGANRLPSLRQGAFFFVAQFFFFVLLIASQGCQHYGTGALPSDHKVYVYLEPVQNEAYISGFANLFQSELVEALRNSPVVVLVQDERQADYSGQVRLRNFDKQAIAYAESDTGQPASARYSIDAWLSLLRREDGSLLLDNNRVTADISVYVDAAQSFTMPGFQSKPTLARDLARNVARSIEYSTLP